MLLTYQLRHALYHLENTGAIVKPFFKGETTE
jgi:hypothetical protein